MKRRGFSMVEVAISSLVMALMMASALNATGLSARIRGGQTAKNRAMLICTDMLSEIRALPFPLSEDVIPAVAMPGTRNAFIDVLDFSGYDSFPPVDPMGAEIPGAQNWWVRVVIAWVDPDNVNNVSATDTGMLRIRVTVYRGWVELASASTLRSAAGEIARNGVTP